MSRIHAHRMIEAAGVCEMLPIGNKPATESQARPLAKLPAEEQAEAAAQIWRISTTVWAVLPSRPRTAPSPGPRAVTPPAEQWSRQPSAVGGADGQHRRHRHRSPEAPPPDSRSMR